MRGLVRWTKPVGKTDRATPSTSHPRRSLGELASGCRSLVGLSNAWRHRCQFQAGSACHLPSSLLRWWRCLPRESTARPVRPGERADRALPDCRVGKLPGRAGGVGVDSGRSRRPVHLGSRTMWGEQLRQFDLPSTFKFDASGRVVKSFGAGAIVFPHGIFVDDDGNVWVADAQANQERTKGHQVFKFSPDGQVLLTLGKAGVAGQDGAPRPAVRCRCRSQRGHLCRGWARRSAGLRDACSTSRIVSSRRMGDSSKPGEAGIRAGEFKTPHSLFFDFEEACSSPIEGTIGSRFSTRKVSISRSGSNSAG